MRSKRAQISSFIKIRPMGAELFHADRQTDMTKLIVAFHNSANAPKIRKFCSAVPSSIPGESKGAFDGRSGNESCFSSNISVFSCQCHCASGSYSFYS